MNLDVDENGRYAVLRTSETEERQLTEGRRYLVLRRDRFRCVFCGSGGRLEADHIIPWSAGGSDEMDNLRTLCHACNQERSNFRVIDDSFRRLPTAHECVLCAPHLLGEPDVVAVYCIRCNRKGPGVPLDPTWHPDVKPQTQEQDVQPEMDDEARTARLVAYQRAAAPPSPMTDDEQIPDEGEDVRDWTGSRIQADALEVPCRYCWAQPGDPCVAKESGKQLQAFPAHACRINDAAGRGATA
jgi:hypothetical protein